MQQLAQRFSELAAQNNPSVLRDELRSAVLQIHNNINWLLQETSRLFTLKNKFFITQEPKVDNTELILIYKSEVANKFTIGGGVHQELVTIYDTFLGS
jgi:hypothetical protein